MREHREELLEEIRQGKYKPQPVRRKEIPKPDGGVRKLGIPTVVDRIIQQAIAQQLTPIYEPLFWEGSYGYRPGRSAQDAIRKVKEYAERGYTQAVLVDLSKYFDTLNHELLMNLLRKNVHDKRVIELIKRYLKAGVMENGLLGKTEEGSPQGGPLSPLLANIYLNEYDQEMAKRGVPIIRYADDIVVLAKSARAAQRLLESTRRYLEGKLKLKMNVEKSKVVSVYSIRNFKFLGFALGKGHNGVYIRAHAKSLKKAKAKLKELTSRSQGRNVRAFYYKGQRGRPPKGVEIMLRMYLLQCWFHLSDEGVEDAIYDSYAFRKFMGINFLEQDVPDATTLLHFRHLLEENGLNKLFFEAINRVMVATGHMMKGGTIVDATIIDAPSSTKNAEKKRDPEMHQTKKGGQWRFGMKCHIGVDARSGLVHTIKVTAANEHDITVASRLIREDDEVVYGDSGYLGNQKREEIQADPHLASIDYRINRRPKSLPKVSDRAIDWERYIERQKSSVRSKVEHAFRIIKRQFGFQKVPYRGLAKNENRLYALFASANLYVLALAKRRRRKA